MAGVTAEQPGVGDLSIGSHDEMGSEMYARRSEVRAPPVNPNFTFPRSPRDSEEPRSSQHARKPRIRPTNLAILPQPHQAVDIPTISPSQLPLPESTLQSSPTRSRPMSARGGHHRREGSQFIGGDGKTGGPGLMSSSPTKGTTNVGPPSTGPPSSGPPSSGPSSAGRRKGHAHRRSGAMSTNDFSAFLNNSVSNAPPLPGSAPATPSGHSHNVPQIPHLERHHSQPQMTTREKIDEANAAGEKEDREMAATPSSAGSRSRVVGFSDKIVVIPRPLSTISQADTESTISTIRASHSVNGSISSVLDQRPPTPVSTAHQMDSSDDSRPTTSDTAIQPEFFGPADDVDMSVSPERPSSGSGNSFLKRRRSPPPHFSRNQDSLSNPALEKSYDLRPSTDSNDPFGASMRSEISAKDGESRSEKKKKGLRSILSRKSRKQSKEDALSATSPESIDSADPNVPEGLMSLEDVNFDEDTSLVIHSAGYKEPTPAPYMPSPSPNEQTFGMDDTAVLDLDATYNSIPTDENSPSHLANFMRGGVGLKQHRRTESAPSLSPVQRTGFIPSKASPKMADVFEEEEEEDSPQRGQRPKARSFHQPKPRELQGLGVQIVDAEAVDSAQPRRKSRSPSSKTNNSDKSSNVADSPSRAPNVPTAQGDTTAPHGNQSPVTTKSSDEESVTPTALGSAPRGSDNPTISPPALPHPNTSRSHPLGFAPPPSLNPHSYHDSSDFSASSSAPSPNLTTISFDAPRLNTAASSITDRTNWSISQAPTNVSNTAACRGDDSAASEDVPSLTSSASTALSGRPSHPSFSASASATASPVVPRGAGAFFGAGHAYHAHTFSGITRPRTHAVIADDAARPNSVGADRAFSLAGLGGLSSRPSMPRQWGSRPSTANGSKRSSLASLSKLMSRGGESERSKLSISWGATDDGSDGAVIGAKEGKDKAGKRRLSRMLKFWKGKDKDRHTARPTTSDPMEGVEVTHQQSN